VTVRGRRGPIVIDTDVFGAELGRSPLVALYEPIIVGRPAFISFQTAAELRYGALRRQWGEKRMRELEAKIAAAVTVHTGPELRSSSTLSCAPTASTWCMPWASVSMTPIGGLRRRPCG
jgi:hypothetical protein